MLELRCPNCGPRNETEFVYGGEVDRRARKQPREQTDDEWSTYLYSVPNVKGWCSEYWWHVHGCGAWIQIIRNTHTHEIRGPE